MPSKKSDPSETNLTDAYSALWDTGASRIGRLPNNSLAISYKNVRLDVYITDRTKAITIFPSCPASVDLVESLYEKLPTWKIAC
jgi:hypothetical protein